MQLNSASRVLESTLNTPVQTFTIAASAKAFQILSSSIYTKKEEAIVRELLANAADAHVAAGRSDVAIKLHLPTELEPWLEVKDFGTGLTENAVLSLYTTYFASDKTHTNDLIGGLGLGSKSPLCYTDQFSVVSRCEDTAAYWSVFVDGSGTPCVTKTDEEPDYELPGLTITIPIDPSDIAAFTRAAANLAPYFQVPIETNVPLNVERSVTATFNTPAGKVLITKGAPYQQAVVQGSIPYQLDMSWAYENLSWSDRNDNVAYMLRNWQFEIHVPIGTFEIATSRESLAYDKPTKERLSSLFGQIATHIVQNFQEQVQNAASYADAISLFHSMSNNIHQLKRVLKTSALDMTWIDDPLWNGKSLKTVAKPQTFSVHRVVSTWARARGNSVKRSIWSDVKKDTIDAHWLAGELIGDDLPILWQAKNAPFKQFFENNPRYCPAVLLTGDEQDIRQWVDDLFGKDKKTLTEIPRVRRVRAHRATNSNGPSAPRPNESAVYSTVIYTHDGAHSKVDTADYTADELLDIIKTGGTVLLDPQHEMENQLTRLLTLASLGVTDNGPLRYVVRATVYQSHSRVWQRLVDAGAFTSLDPIESALVYDLECISKWADLKRLSPPNKMGNLLRAKGFNVHHLRYFSVKEVAEVANGPTALLWWIQNFYEYITEQSSNAETALRYVPAAISEEAVTAYPSDGRLERSIDMWEKALDAAVDQLHQAQLTPVLLNDMFSGCYGYCSNYEGTVALTRLLDATLPDIDHTDEA